MAGRMKFLHLKKRKILKLSDIKPNFSELARFYELDRRTVKKYYDGYEGKAAHRDKPSKLDKHYDLIKQKFSIRGSNVRTVYEFILSERVSDIRLSHFPGVRLLTAYKKFIPAFSATFPSEPYSFPTIRHFSGVMSAS